MTSRRRPAVEVVLSTLAGFIDAQGYLSLGGFFVAFMSGNSTEMGVAVGRGVGLRTAMAGGLVLSFVAGVVIGTLVGRWFGTRRPPFVLLLMAVILAAAGGLHWLGLTAPAGFATAIAMGAENTVFQKDGQSGIGLTYMTGTLVRVGQRVAEALGGGPWRAAMLDGLLWAGMVAGAAAGVRTYDAIGLDSLWIATAITLGIAGVMRINLPVSDAARH